MFHLLLLSPNWKWISAANPYGLVRTGRDGGGDRALRGRDLEMSRRETKDSDDSNEMRWKRVSTERGLGVRPGPSPT